jgi:DNA repair protein RadA/Sms
VVAKAKTKSAWFCQNCGVESAKWVGKCPSCGEWNTFVEEIVVKSKNVNIVGSKGDSKNKPLKISEISSSEEKKIQHPKYGVESCTWRRFGSGVLNPDWR